MFDTETVQPLVHGHRHAPGMGCPNIWSVLHAYIANLLYSYYFLPLKLIITEFINTFIFCVLKCLYYLLLHRLPQLSTHTLNTRAWKHQKKRIFGWFYGKLRCPVTNLLLCCELCLWGIFSPFLTLFYHYCPLIQFWFLLVILERVENIHNCGITRWLWDSVTTNNRFEANRIIE